MIIYVLNGHNSSTLLFAASLPWDVPLRERDNEAARTGPMRVYYAKAYVHVCYFFFSCGLICTRLVFCYSLQFSAATSVIPLVVVGVRARSFVQLEPFIFLRPATSSSPGKTSSLLSDWTTNWTYEFARILRCAIPRDISFMWTL